MFKFKAIFLMRGKLKQTATVKQDQEVCKCGTMLLYGGEIQLWNGCESQKAMLAAEKIKRKAISGSL